MKLIYAALCFLLMTTAHAADESKLGLHHESEAGVLVTTGNAKSQSYNLKQATSYGIDLSLLKFTGSYTNTSSKGVESAKSWDLGLRYDEQLTGALSGFLGEKIEGNPFSGFLQRYNTDLGAKWLTLQSGDEANRFSWSNEGGYRFSRENQISGKTVDQNYIRVYTAVDKTWDARLTLGWWMEVLPNLTQTNRYLINSEASVKMILNRILALKTAYLVNYDAAPPVGVAYKTDTSLTTSLVAKF